MLRGVAEPGGEYERALQIQSDVVLVGEADRTVDLNCFPRNAQPCIRAARFKATCNRRPLTGRGVAIEIPQAVLEHRRSELALNVKIDRAVLERLEAADR